MESRWCRGRPRRPVCTGCARPCGPGCHPEGTVTLFTYDSHNRVTSMQRATGTSGSGHTSPTWRYEHGCHAVGRGYDDGHRP
ncbi:hypothetical protein ACH4UX_30250 [Streptomyces althioticus]|uniref:hypothetical protein n=1 Tax=Streptomyces althioticus TaxID=83380 RepID=UPI003793986F